MVQSECSQPARGPIPEHITRDNARSAPLAMRGIARGGWEGDDVAHRRLPCSRNQRRSMERQTRFGASVRVNDCAGRSPAGWAPTKSRLRSPAGAHRVGNRAKRRPPLLRILRRAWMHEWRGRHDSMDGGGKPRLEQAAEDAGSTRSRRPKGVQSHLHIHVLRPLLRILQRAWMHEWRGRHDSMDGGGKPRLEQAAEDAGSARLRHLHIHVLRREGSGLLATPQGRQAATTARSAQTRRTARACVRG